MDTERTDVRQNVPMDMEALIKMGRLLAGTKVKEMLADTGNEVDWDAYFNMLEVQYMLERGGQ